MTWTAALLIITSAVMHALWNFVSKRRHPSLAFFSVAAASAAVAASPLVVIHWRLMPLIPASAWALIVATGFAQAVYFSGLSGAYQHGDLSLAYPLARALPVLMVAAISILIGRGQQIGGIGLLGMVLISFGCIILPLPRFRGLRLRDYRSAVYHMAVVAAIGTTAYTLIDDSALRQLRTAADLPLTSTQTTLLFIALQALSTTIVLGLVSLARSPERRRLAAMVHNRQQLTSGMLTGVFIMATYGLVLVSLAYVRNVSYVAAFRQLSIPIGAVLGLTLQQEPPYRPKLVGIIIISVGLIMVGVG
jgi:drug/metabolite transporter (DMT)-like permease